MEWLFSAYVAASAFGGSLILVSLLFGGDSEDFDKDFDKDFEFDSDADADVDVDADADVDVDADVDGDFEGVDKDFPAHLAAGSDAIWLPFLSLRFWTFGLASFGLTGLLLSFLSVGQVSTLVAAVVAGGGIGTAAAWFFRQIKSDSVSGEIGFERLAGEEARVLLTVRPGSRGKIVVQSASGRIEMMATTRDEKPIERGARVLIAQVRDGVADVSRLTPSRKGDAERRRSAQAAAKQAQQTVDPRRNGSG